jgi:probable HAF family extracellular repeat protein
VNHPAHQLRLLALLAAACLACAANAAAPRYELTVLGGFGGTESVATAINNKGHVTGYANTAAEPSAYRAFTYKGPGTLKAVPRVPGYVQNRGAAINDRGQVVGEIYGGNPLYSGFLHDSAGTKNLAKPGSDWISATDINNVGHVVGTHSSTGAFILVAGRATTLFPGFSASAYAVNDVDQVTGEYYVEELGHVRAFIYSGQRKTLLGTLGGEFSIGTAINNAGAVTGGSPLVPDGPAHAFRYHRGVMSDLGTLGGSSSFGEGINSAGHIVGGATDRLERSRAFLHRDGRMYDLNNLANCGSGFVLNLALAINDRGQIVGYGHRSDGKQRGFLLTPVRAD